MREDAALQVLLVEAFETADPDGRLLTDGERTRATLEARATGGGDPVATVVARARILTRLLVGRVPPLRAALQSARFPAGVASAIVLVAGALGLFGNALGAARHINILSLPLLSLVGWNLAVYAALAGAAVRRALRAGSDGRAPTPVGIRGAWARGLGWAVGRLWPRAGVGDADAARVVDSALAAWGGAWRRTVAPLWMARVRLLLHLAAVALAVGMLGGMYLRGVAFEYQATWESTFLGPRGLHAILGVVLGPASAVLGQPLPGSEELASIRAPRSGEAALWIHLFAVTTGLAVIAPRGALLAVEAHRARRLANDLPVDLDSAYFRRLLAADRGDATRVDVVPYSIHLAPRQAEALTGTLRDLAGHRARLAVCAPVDYGTEADELLRVADALGADGPTSGERWLAVLFSLAQAPEPEVHGELLGALRTWVARSPAARRLLVIVDDSRYRQQLAATGAERDRVGERRRAWDRVMGLVGLTAAHVDLTAGRDGSAIAIHLVQGIWPALTAGAGRR